MTKIVHSTGSQLAVVEFPLSHDKRVQLRLPPDQDHVVRAYDRVGLVFAPTDSPLYGELLLHRNQFHTIGGILAALRATLGGWQVELPQVGHWSLELTLVSERLQRLLPTEAVVSQQQAITRVVNALTGVRDDTKRDAQLYASEAVQAAAPGHAPQTEASQWAQIAAAELMERHKVVERMFRITATRARALTETLDAYLSFSAKMIEFLEHSHQLDPTTARQRYYQLLGGRAAYKPWNFVFHQHELHQRRGFDLSDRGYASRLRESYLFEASVPRLLSTLNRLTGKHSYPSIARHRREIAQSLSENLRLLQSFEPLDCYAVLIAQIADQIEQIIQLLQTDPWPSGVALLKTARQRAEAAQFVLRYRIAPGEPDRSDWYQTT